MAAAISVERFSKRYGELLAVDDVSLEVRPGEVFALVGPNGAGKTSLVRAIVGIHAPTSGTVRVAGFDLATDPISAKEKLGFLPEVAQLYESLTAREHLTLVARLHGIADSDSAPRIEGMLETLELLEAADAPIATFSKGMKQKTALAGALIAGPEVLVLDEPMSGLDAEAALMVKGLVRELAASGRAVLYTSHLLDVVEKVADRVAILVKGKVAAMGTLTEIRATAGVSGDLGKLFATLVRAEDPNERARELLRRAAKPGGR
jgi:ABC-2 type transport system ATP-binding protein